MELRRKIARLVMSHISNRDGDDIASQFHRLKTEVLKLGIGGYTIFGGNVDSTHELVSGLESDAPQALLVASDLDRGLGQQLEGGTVFPSQMALGATGIADLAYAQGWATAREARAAGISLIFTPVADVASQINNPIIGVRSFGGDPQMVADMTYAFIRGCQHAGAAATAKHFPGHGDTRVDSHIELPTVDSIRSVIDARELVPFRAAVRAGVRCVMTAHVAYPRLTPRSVPATLSRAIVTGILRDQLGFEGVVVTDALLMGAITATYGPAEAALMALDAGVDLLLMPVDVGETIAGLREAVDQGRLSEARIDESLERIDELHRWIGDYRDEDEDHLTFPPELDGAFDVEEHLPGNHRAEMNGGHEPVARSIARRAVTLVSDQNHILPLGTFVGDAGATALEEPGGAPLHAGEGAPLGGGDAGAELAVFALKDSDTPVNLVWLRSQLQARIPGVDIATVDETCGKDALDGLVESAGAAVTVVIAIFDDVAAWKGRSGPSERLVAIARRLVAASERPIVLAFAGPDLALALPRDAAFLCCYDSSPHCQRAAVECLFGERPIAGRLPVALPPMYGIGWGLRR